MALNIIENAKTSRPSVCNAAEVCIVHSEIADKFLPALYERICEARRESGLVPVELRADERASALLGYRSSEAGENDFDTEFLDYILAIKTVDSVKEAVEHIALHSTHHSEAIITKSIADSSKFETLIDSACVYTNASTRFTDGGEFGLGAEIGISTQKLHARGPMGLYALTTEKFLVKGQGQVR